jgi:hypothetical protein
MYITNEGRSYYNSHGEQHSSRAPFLLLLQDKDQNIGIGNMNGIVRKVALKQFGHWMMGTARIKNTSIIVSGAYGRDGLPVSVTKKIFDMGKPIPKELYDKWNDGGGWNSAGNEADDMRKWALENF